MKRLQLASHVQCGDSDEIVPNDGSHWLNDLYQVSVTRMGVCKLLSIKPVRDAPPGALHDWRNFQSIKNQLCGPDCEAIELYPAEDRLVDTADQFYLLAMPRGLRIPWGFVRREVSEELATKRNTQRPFDPDERPADLKEQVTLDPGANSWVLGPIACALPDGTPVWVANGEVTQPEPSSDETEPSDETLGARVEALKMVCSVLSTKLEMSNEELLTLLNDAESRILAGDVTGEPS